MRAIRRTIVLLLASALPAVDAGAQSAVDRTIDQVGELLKKGEGGEAVDRLQQLAPRASPGEQPRLTNALGYTLFSMGQEEAAAEQLQRARALAQEQGDHETLLKATNNLGVLEFNRGNLSAARAAFNSAAEMGSDFAADYLAIIDRQEMAERASVLIDEGVQAVRYKQDYATAVERYSEALEIDPENARALDFRGYALFRMGELDTAREDLERAVALDPANVLARLNLAKVLCAGDQPLLPDLRPRDKGEVDLYASDGELQRVCGKRIGELLG